MATQVTFGKGNKSEYTDKNGQIYFASDEKKIYLNGEVYGDGAGDSSVYTPQDTTATTMAIGGIAAGTKASDLENKSVSEVFDMLLYPEYAPQYYSASIKLSQTNNIGRALGEEVHNYSDVSATSYTPARTQASGQNTVYGGRANSIVWSGTGKTYNDSNSYYLVFPATYTYTATASFPAGTEPNVSSKGNKTQKISTINMTTLLATASNSDAIDATTYVIKATTASASYTVKTQVPIYGTTVTIKDPNTTSTSITSKSGTGVSIKLVAEPDTNYRQTFKIPGKLTKIETYNEVSGQYVETDKSDWAETTETKTFGKGTNTVSLQYYVYTWTGTQKGESKYKITFTEAS